MPPEPSVTTLRLTDVDTAARAVARLALMRPARAGGCRVVAIDGPSGAGKSTLAQWLSPRLGAAPVVRLDDVYPGWDGLEAGVQQVVSGVLEPISRGQTAQLRRYDWVRERAGECYDVPAAATVLLEGCGAGAGVCRPYLSLLAWVEAPERVRYERAMARDGESYRPHWSSWADQECAHFDREGTRGRADVVLDTSGLPADRWRGVRA